MNKIIVIKMGGIATKNITPETIQQLQIWIKQRYKIIIVHGGGKVIEELLINAGHTTIKKDGLRITSQSDLPIIKEALFNHVGAQLTAYLKKQNIAVNHLKEKQLSFIQAEYLNYKIYGSVGTSIQINPNYINDLLNKNNIPVLASLGTHINGELININADHLATAIAISLKAQKLILMTDVKGVIENGKLINRLHINEVQTKIKENIITGGMIPKIESAVDTVKAGVNKVIIGDNLLTGTVIEGNIK